MTDSYAHRLDATTKPTFSMQEERDLFEAEMRRAKISIERMEGASDFYAYEGTRMAWAGWLARARVNDER